MNQLLSKRPKCQPSSCFPNCSTSVRRQMVIERPEYKNPWTIRPVNQSEKTITIFTKKAQLLSHWNDETSEYTYPLHPIGKQK